MSISDQDRHAGACDWR